MTNLISLLTAFEPTDEKERIDRDTMCALLPSLPEPFSRSQWPAHFTGSAVVVSPGGARVCLVLHAKLNRWLQPGGHSEVADDEQLEATALREAREETGLKLKLYPGAAAPFDLDIHLIPARKAEPEHRHLDVRYLLEAANPDSLKPDPTESHQIQWFEWDEAIARADESAMKRMLQKARRRVASAY